MNSIMFGLEIGNFITNIILIILVGIIMMGGGKNG